MKNINPLLFVVSLVALTFTSTAQTNTPPTPAGVISTLGAWLGNYNTNLVFQDIIIWDGPIYQNQINVANEIGASYDVFRSKPLSNGGDIFVAPEGRFRQAGIGGVWLSESGGLQFGWMKFDFRIAGYCDGVYLNNPQATGVNQREQVEFGAQAEKMLTPSTAVGMFVGGQTRHSYPIFGVNLNVSFGNGTGFLGLF